MTIWLWIGFLAFVLVMLALDLGVFNREARVIHTREALRWTGLCVLLAGLFTIFVYFAYQNDWLSVAKEAPKPKQMLWGSRGATAAMEFFTGYVIEMSLSMDNIFVIALIFSYFCVPRIYQHRVLFWGILGALVMRGVMILAGTKLIEHFHWIIYVFGALLIVTAIKMLLTGEGKVEPDRNPLVRIARYFYPVTPGFEGEKFFTKLDGKRAITPLFLTLLIVESTDVLFAIDSIPAIFAITYDPFIVFTSNVFAILCLRSMYFALAGMLEYFRYLKYSLVVLLMYVGMKMLVSDYLKNKYDFEIHIVVSLMIIIGVLVTGILTSLLHPPDHSSSENCENETAV
jgi:tellurite resistance protein TerC